MLYIYGLICKMKRIKSVRIEDIIFCVKLCRIGGVECIMSYISVINQTFTLQSHFFFLHNHQYNANDNGAMEHYFWNISHKFANLQAHNLLAKKKSCKIYFICSTNSMDVRFTRKTLELKFE